ncbi:hypothetical protein ACFU99_01195 [Streptomyces sp. NPDC057654]|uniref:hypothetical protein n=1 Tax=Streptomyces sp. NPDC057654 TaxID=3346196 RepID=UPI0036CE91DE
MHADLSLLTTAAEQWDESAKKFEEVKRAYDGQVKSVGHDGSWNGTTAIFARPNMAETSGQFAAAPKEARAIASLLRDAHTQFVDLKNKVKSAVADAETNGGVKISSEGKAVFDPESADRIDPAWAHAARLDAGKREQAESYWTKHIEQAVRAVDDADQGVKLALTTAVHNTDVMHGGLAGFNASAEGDIEKVEGRRAEELATKLNTTGHLDAGERAEMQRLFRDNGHSKEFTQTFLSGLGPKGALTFTNKLNDLAYFDDKKNKGDYLALEKGLATSLATATRVPRFKGPKNEPLKFGTPGYEKAYKQWLTTSDSAFYRDWRSGLQKAGLEKYGLEAATEKTNTISRDHDQKVRGYQSLLTLMKQGDGYSPQFMSDVTDDMIAAERKDHDVWDLHGEFHGKEDGWFAHDPVDTALGIMSHDPDTTTAYLDPGSSGEDAEHRANDRLNYLLHDRDWKITDNTTWYGNIEHRSGDTEAPGAREGLASAIEAASTGHEPGAATGHPGAHSEAQARVMQDTISILDVDGSGDSIPQNLQKPLGRALATYVPDTHDIIVGQNSDKGGNAGQPGIHGSGDNAHLANNQASLLRVLRGVSDDDATYAALYHAERAYSAEVLSGGTHSGNTHDSIGDWDHRAATIGKVNGAYNAIGSDIILDKRDSEVGWVNDTARYTYHGAGIPITMIPVVGDEAQRALDAATYEWSKDVINEKEGRARADNSENYAAGLDGTNKLIDKWAVGRHAGESTAVDRMKDEAEQSYTSGRDAAYTALRTPK